MLKQVPVSQENLNLDPQGPVATGNLDLQVRVFAGIPMGKPTGNPLGPAPIISPILQLGNSMGMGNPHGLGGLPIMGKGVGWDFSTHGCQL